MSSILPRVIPTSNKSLSFRWCKVAIGDRAWRAPPHHEDRQGAIRLAQLRFARTGCFAHVWSDAHAARPSQGGYFFMSNFSKLFKQLGLSSLAVNTQLPICAHQVAGALRTRHSPRPLFQEGRKSKHSSGAIGAARRKNMLAIEWSGAALRTVIVGVAMPET
jgi:hypothetical protein